MKSLKLRVKERKEREERRKKERNQVNILKRALSLKKISILLVSSTSPKRGRGEGGRWTEERTKTPNPVADMERAMKEVVEIDENEVESEKEKPAVKTEYRAMMEDRGEGPQP